MKKNNFFLIAFRMRIILSPVKLKKNLNRFVKCKHFQIVTFLTLLCLEIADDKLHCPAVRQALGHGQ